MHNISLTYKQLNILLIQIEGILNSRQFFAHSNEPNDLKPICPSHFLIGRTMHILLEMNLKELLDNRLSSLETVQKYKQQFWTRFQKEYVTQLYHSYKQRNAILTPIKVGTLVLVNDDNTLLSQQLMSRVDTLIQGNYNVVRVATIKIKHGIIIRKVRQLCPLPLQTDLVLQFSHFLS